MPLEHIYMYGDWHHFDYVQKSSVLWAYNSLIVHTLMLFDCVHAFLWSHVHMTLIVPILVLLITLVVHTYLFRLCTCNTLIMHTQILWLCSTVLEHAWHSNRGDSNSTWNHLKMFKMTKIYILFMGYSACIHKRWLLISQYCSQKNTKTFFIQ